MRYPVVKSEKLFFLNDRSAWLSAFIGNLFTVPFVFIFKNKKYVDPNAISLMSLILFFSCSVFYLLDPTLSIFCSIGFFISYLLDSTDGKLARIRGKGTKFGGLLDATIDLLCHSVGLAIVSIGMCIKIGSLLPFFIFLPYLYYLGYSHLKDIFNILYANTTKKKMIPKNRWQNFCYNNGLSSYIYNDWEVVYVCILGIAINLDNPILFLIISIYTNLLIKIINHLKNDNF
tara:strand:+ start:123 stop:815 length:693 start_codon:yes stop_codon:yes gene_type:complete